MFHIRGYPILLKAEVCRSFITTTVREQYPRSHHNLKGAPRVLVRYYPKTLLGPFKFIFASSCLAGGLAVAKPRLERSLKRLTRCGPGPPLLSPSQSQSQTVSSPGSQAP